MTKVYCAKFMYSACIATYFPGEEEKIKSIKQINLKVLRAWVKTYGKIKR